MATPRQIEEAMTGPFRATDDPSAPGSGEWQAACPDIPVTFDFSAFDPAGAVAFIQVQPRCGDTSAVDIGLSAYRGNPTLTLAAFVQAGQAKSIALDMLGVSLGFFEGKIIPAADERIHMRGYSDAVPVAFLDGYSTLTMQINFVRN